MKPDLKVIKMLDSRIPWRGVDEELWTAVCPYVNNGVVPGDREQWGAKDGARSESDKDAGLQSNIMERRR